MMRRAPLLAMVIALGAPGFAAAQPQHNDSNSPVHNLVQSQDKDQPIQIEATTLEVHDKSKTATFIGNVQVVQGDTTMKCKTLVVFYGQEVGIDGSVPLATAAKPAQSLPQGAQNIRRIEAHGGVTVTSKDQNASGDLGVYDLKSKTITLTGNVVVSQGQNVIHGERVVVDTTTGNARVESSTTAGTAPSRVRALIVPNKGQNGGPSNFMTIGPGHTN